MRLEPVYLLAPQPQKAPISRRRILAAIAGFSVAGFGAGFVIGSRGRGAPRSLPTSEAGPLDLLDWAIEVQAGAESTLIDTAGRFLMIAGHTADARLVTGVERLASLLTETDHIPAEQRADLARVLVMLSVMEPYPAALRDHLSGLRAVAREAR